MRDAGLAKTACLPQRCSMGRNVIDGGAMASACCLILHMVYERLPPRGRRPGELPPLAFDGMTKTKMVAAFAAVTFIAVLSGSGDRLAEGSLPLATWLAALVWAQVRWPLTGLVAGICSVVAMRLAELTTGGWLWPVTLLYVSVVIGPRPRLRLVVGIAAVHAVWAFNLEWTVLQHSASRAIAGVGPDVLWLTAALAVTVAIGSWRQWTQATIQQQRAEAEQQRAEIQQQRAEAKQQRAEIERQQAEAERQRAEIQQQRAEIEQQRTEERLRVAREVHDTVAHTLAVVGVHLNVAADALDSAPGEARAALRLAQDVRRRAMGDLSSLVGVLRDDLRPTAEPLDLEALVAQVRAAGLDARLHVDGGGGGGGHRDGGAVPLPVRLAVGLIVREALTNTVRHAAASTVTVEVHYGPATRVTVTDDGRGSTAPAGHGLTGMRERVEALGGRVTTDGAGGFTVHATIPS